MRFVFALAGNSDVTLSSRSNMAKERVVEFDLDSDESDREYDSDSLFSDEASDEGGMKEEVEVLKDKVSDIVVSPLNTQKKERILNEIQESKIVDPKNVTKLQAMRALDELDPEWKPPTPIPGVNASLDDFDLDNRMQPKTPLKAKQREYVPAKKSNEYWTKEVKGMLEYWKSNCTVFPADLCTDRFKKKNWRKRAKEKFSLMDGQLYYFHKRNATERGRFPL